MNQLLFEIHNAYYKHYVLFFNQNFALFKPIIFRGKYHQLKKALTLL